MTIDWEFIGELEGTRADGYVPLNNDGTVAGNSGVTFGTGVDLGSKNDDYFTGLPETLVAKLRPYYGKKGQDALTYIRNNPLTLTDPEVEQLNIHVKTSETNLLKNRWTRDTGLNFDDLPSNVATSIASVAFQHGAGAPEDTYKKFWTAATNLDTSAMEKELRDFNDNYAPRREAEADYLAREQKSQRVRDVRPGLLPILQKQENKAREELQAGSLTVPISASGPEYVELVSPPREPELASDLIDLSQAVPKANPMRNKNEGGEAATPDEQRTFDDVLRDLNVEVRRLGGRI